MTLVEHAPAPAATVSEQLLELPVRLAQRAAAACLAAMQKREDTLTPVLNYAYFDGAQLMSTDRHRIAQFSLPETLEAPDDRLVYGAGFLVSRVALIWATKVKPAKRYPLVTMSDGGDTIRFERTEHGLTVSLVNQFGNIEDSAIFPYPADEPHYPPVNNLVARWAPAAASAPETLDPRLFADFLTFATKHAVDGVFSVEHGQAKSERTPGPTKVTAGGAVFLIQPKRPLR